MNKHSGFSQSFYALIIASIFVALLAGVYFYQQSKINLLTQQVSSPTPHLSPNNGPSTGFLPQFTPTPTLPVAPTGWKTYKNDKYSFEFQYPSDLIVQQDSKPDDLFSIVFYSPDLKRSNNELSSWVESGYEFDLTIYGQKCNNPEKSGEIKYGYSNYKRINFQNTNAQEYDFKSEGGDWHSLEIDKDNKCYILGITPSSKNSIFNQILSTFKFTSPTPTPTVSLTKVKIMDTSDWQSHQCSKIVTFKIPSTGYNIKCNGDSAVITAVNGFSPSATISVSQYDGGSRRQYWINAMSVPPKEVAKYMRFQESQYGSVVGLDIFASGGWWQGGYASPLLIAHGKTIVAIHAGQNFNDQTGEISRSIFADSIASTIKFTN
jgi:hypothetical protein